MKKQAMKKVVSVKDDLPKKTIVSFPKAQTEVNYCDYSRLTLFDKVFLGAMLSEGLDISYSHVKPINMLSGALMPNNELLISTLRQLIQDEILVTTKEPSKIYNLPFLNSESSNIYSKKPIYSSTYWNGIQSTPFYLNCHPSKRAEVIEGLINPPNTDIFSEFELIHLWRSLAVWECVEYLEHKIFELFGVAHVDKNNMFNVMSQHLVELSQAEIFKTIETSVFNALSYTNQKGINKERGAENALTTYQIFANNAINKEGWYKRAFEERPKDAPQSLILQFFLKRVLNREDNGFNVIPKFSELA